MARNNPVDPNQLLKALSSLLSKEGGIKGVKEVNKILILMKSAKKMVSRCIYMNILISTKDSAVQEKFIEVGGWELLNSWLQDAKIEEQNPVILELIKVFKELPVTIDVLKKNNTAKIIKSFSKAEGEDELKAMADDLVSTWKEIIRTSNIEKAEKGDKDKEKSPGSKKKPKAKKVQKTLSNDRDADDESDEPLAKKLRLGSIEGEPMDTSDASKPSRVRHLSDSRTTRAGAAARSAARKGSSEEPLKKEGDEKKDEVVKKKRAAIMRPAHTKIRSTGLEKDAELPLPKFKKKIPAPPPPKTEKPIPTLTIRKDGPIFSKSLSPTEKRPRPDELAKPVGYGRIKIIPAQKHKLQESSGFLDALNAPSLVVKKKIPKKVARSNSTGSNKAKSPTPPEEIKVEPPKFSFYSSNQPAEEEKKEEETEKTEQPVPKATKDEGDIGEDWNEERPITVGKSNLKFGPSKSKKQVRWKEETDMVDVYYFELDETERVNVNKVKDFQDAIQIEKMMEKQNIKNAHKMGHAEEEDKTNGNTTQDYFTWKKPTLMHLPGVAVNYGCNSQEIAVQTKREGTVLREIFFDPMNLPVTPKEPDPEAKRSVEEIRIIPLEDEASAAELPVPEPLFPPDRAHFMHHGPGASGGGMGPGPGLMGPAPGGPGGLMGPGPGGLMGPGPGGLMGPGPVGLLGPGPGGPPGGHPGGSPRGPMQHRPPGPGQGNTPPSPNTTIKNVQNLLATLSEGGAENSGSDLLKKENLDKLKEMLEPFKNQNPGDNQQREEGNGPPFHPGQGPGGPPGPGNFGRGPGDFGPHNDHGGPFPPMGPDGPMGMGPGPGHGPGPPFDGPGMGPGGQFHPRFGPGPGPNFNGPRGMGMGPPGRGGGFPDRGRGGFPDRGRGGFPDRGRGHPDMGMGPRGPWRGGPGHGEGESRRPVCFHYQSDRGCLRGNHCHFLHPGANRRPL